MRELADWRVLEKSAVLPVESQGRRMLNVVRRTCRVGSRRREKRGVPKQEKATVPRKDRRLEVDREVARVQEQRLDCS